MKNTVRVRTIKTKREHASALRLIDQLLDAKPNTEKGDLLEILSILVEKYEDDHFVIENPDPVEAIKFRMEQLGYTTQELAPLLGGKSRVSEILKKKRTLSLTMVRNLNREWGIPAESLIRE